MLEYTDIQTIKEMTGAGTQCATCEESLNIIASEHNEIEQVS